MDLRNQVTNTDALHRIETALQAAVSALSSFVPGSVKVNFKHGDDPVTEADRIADRVLKDILLRDGEGWLSEETADDVARLDKERVWVVDPLDGTREFVSGIPEWCVSVGLVENGKATAGGICNPATGEIFLGSLDKGVTYNGMPTHVSRRRNLSGATVLASRSEMRRGEWERFQESPFVIRPTGSVAYKLGLVSVGLADATWTLSPKNEWDVAAGVALVKAAGGFVGDGENSSPTFNKKCTLLSGLLACGPYLRGELISLLDAHTQASGSILSLDDEPDCRRIGVVLSESNTSQAEPYVPARLV